jgi:hypothetical protein
MSVLGRQRLVLYFIFLLSSLVYFVNGQIDPVVIKVYDNLSVLHSLNNEQANAAAGVTILPWR